MRILHSYKSGSSLFGTFEGGESDIDITQIVLPSLKDMIRGNEKLGIVLQDNGQKEHSQKSDVTIVPLQRLVNDYAKGRAYAVESMFTSHDGSPRYDSSFENFQKQLTSRFPVDIQHPNGRELAKNILKRQSIREFHAILLRILGKVSPQITPLQCFGVFTASMNGHASDLSNVLIYSPRNIFFLGKSIGNTSLGELEKLVASKIDSMNYPRENYHCLRTLDEQIMLRSTGKLTFPFSEDRIHRYLDIKHGKIPVKDFCNEVSSKDEYIATFLKKVINRDEFEDFVNRYLHFLYGLSYSY